MVGGSNPFAGSGDLAHLAERLACNQEVAGSTPVVSIMPRKTENQRVKHAVRKRARKRMDAIYARQNSLCFWCHSACVILANIPEGDRVSVSGGFVTWNVGESAFRARLATIDHIVPIGSNGTNEHGNLVMACIDCNKDRTSQKRIEKVCKECGSKLHSRSRRCQRCRIDRSIAWLKQNGWSEVQSSDGVKTHTKFRDPETGIDHILRHACAILSGRDVAATM